MMFVSTKFFGKTSDSQAYIYFDSRLADQDLLAGKVSFHSAVSWSKAFSRQNWSATRAWKKVKE